jgi:hypothetical protein
MKKTVALIAIFVLVLAICSTAFAWPGYLEGRPSEFQPGNSQGYFIWHDRGGLNLRTTSRGHEAIYTGAIRTNGSFLNITRVREENSDRVRVDYDNNTIRFHFRTSGHDVDGLDFTVRGGDWVQFELYRDGDLVSSREIHLGNENVHPRHNGFSIHR